MSIITFINKDIKETGQTLAASAIASSLAIEHNYRILLISTDFNDKTLENSFFPIEGVKKSSFFSKQNLNIDISNGMEGLVRVFASNRASGNMIKSYTRPILRDRLDILPGPKTTDYKTYLNMSNYFSQIADVANSIYDTVIVDLSNKVTEENQMKLLNISNLVILGLTQNIQSILDFQGLKEEKDFYQKNNVILALEKYNPDSKYSSKNVARYLSEKELPLTIPYNILFSDYCSEGKIIDYLLSMQGLNSKDGKDGYFCETLKKTADKIDYKRQEQEYGINS